MIPLGTLAHAKLEAHEKRKDEMSPGARHLARLFADLDKGFAMHCCGSDTTEVQESYTPRRPTIVASEATKTAIGSYPGSCIEPSEVVVDSENFGEILLRSGRCGHQSPHSNHRCERKSGHPGDHASATKGLWQWGDRGFYGGGLKAMEIAYGKEAVAESRRKIRES